MTARLLFRLFNTHLGGAAKQRLMAVVIFKLAERFATVGRAFVCAKIFTGAFWWNIGLRAVLTSRNASDAVWKLLSQAQSEQR
jgi:hypothetical protein